MWMLLPMLLPSSEVLPVSYVVSHIVSKRSAATAVLKTIVLARTNRPVSSRGSTELAG